MAKTVIAKKPNKVNKTKKTVKAVKTVISVSIKKKSAGTKPEKNQSAAKKQKRKTNLLKLCSVMNNYADDANDKEIIKRFKTTITSSVNEDISKTNLESILKRPEDVVISEYPESLQPYIKHYLFMFNRDANKKKIKK